MCMCACACVVVVCCFLFSEVKFLELSKTTTTEPFTKDVVIDHERRFGD